jgi:hypothetical protein
MLKEVFNGLSKFFTAKRTIMLIVLITLAIFLYMYFNIQQDVLKEGNGSRKKKKPFSFDKFFGKSDTWFKRLGKNSPIKY